MSAGKAGTVYRGESDAPSAKDSCEEAGAWLAERTVGEAKCADEKMEV